MDVHLNFVNRSDDPGNARIVIFAKNALGGIDEMPVAWLVIDGTKPGDARRFVYPAALAVGANDEAGNEVPPQPAQPGQLFAMQQTGNGLQLVAVGAASKPGEIQVLHGLDGSGLIGAGIYKDGRLLATRQSIAPRYKAVFVFKPVLWIGAVAPQQPLQQGRVIHPAVQAGIGTQLSLEGVASADIVMTGGGTGPQAAPFRFALENVVPG